MIISYKNKKPVIEGKVAQNATIIGNVTCKKDSSIWYGAVLRGDTCSITIGKNSNIQDNAVIHGDPGFPVVIEDNVSIGHGAVIHGCRIGKNTVIGMNATILNGSQIGQNCIIGANALVSQGTIIEDNCIALGVPCRVIKKISEKQIQQNIDNANEYKELKEALLP
ncbi:gamma carbonic anhydrase family protein [Floccifex sp.]|uniref:gamma carbonic anhydrase family protein n=1 Tax=Floccifex sp. TaxID=2815810 RepID=UPI003F0651E1